MKIEFGDIYPDLLAVSEVVDDSLLEKDKRNVIFRITGTVVDLIGVNQYVLFTRTLDAKMAVVSGNTATDPVYIQLNSKELLNFLGTYRTGETKVDKITFEQTKQGVKLTVVESDTTTKKTTTSSWDFGTYVINAQLLSAINRTAPTTGLTQIKGSELKSYTRNLLPITEPGTGIFSKVVFGTDYAVAFSKTHVTFIKNGLGSPMSGIQMPQRCVAFLDKVMCEEEDITVGLDTPYMYLKGTNSEAYIRYEDKLPDYKKYIDVYSTDHSMTVDLAYFKAMLKRVGILRDEAVTIKLLDDESALMFANSHLNQELPVLASEDMAVLKGKAIRVMPEVFEKAIIAGACADGGGLNLYLAPITETNALLCFGDSTGNWFSAINIKLITG